MVIFPGGDGWIRAFNPHNGELLWKFDCNPKEMDRRLGPQASRSDFIATPVVWEDKLYVGVGQDPEHGKGFGHLWCIDITKEPRNKDKDLSPATRPPAKKGGKPQTIFDPRDPANKDSGLVWHFGGEVPETDDEYPRNYYFGRTMSTCSVHDGLCYAADFDGWVYCLDARTGRPYWQHDTRDDIWGSPLWVDGHVYLPNEAGKVLVFGHGKEKKLVSQIDMGRGCRIRGVPVVANGLLYLVTTNPCRLVAIAER
jgi:outer membrane protein assembly factor BamB